MKDETLLSEKMTADYAWGNLGVPAEDCSAWANGWNARAALQSGNSGQLNHANSFTDDELMGMAHGDNPVANAYRELLEFRRNAAGGNSAQPVTVPAGYVLVPVEPTDLMVEAMYRHPLSMRGALKSAIAAAPKGGV